MSIAAMARVWDDETLTSPQKFVLLSLADHADEEGCCYPSISRLVRRTKLGERTVQRAVQFLRDSGYLTVEMNAGKRGSNLYKLHLAPVRVTPRQSDTPVTEAGLPPSERRGTPVTAAPEPSRTPIETPKGASFSDFWKAWPKKVAKERAEKNWRKLSQSDRSAAAKNAARWFEQWRASNPQASPIHPGTYLSDKRWRDFEVEDEANPKERAALIADMLKSTNPVVREAGRKMQEATE